jgi:hypothetical protein
VHNAPADDSESTRELGVRWRPVSDTICDTVAWLHAQGYVSDRQAGAAAGRPWHAGSRPELEPS